MALPIIFPTSTNTPQPAATIMQYIATEWWPVTALTAVAPLIVVTDPRTCPVTFDSLIWSPRMSVDKVIK